MKTLLIFALIHVGLAFGGDCVDAKWDVSLPRKVVSSTVKCSGKVEKICTGYVYCKSKADKSFTYRRLSTCRKEFCDLGSGAQKCVNDMDYFSQAVQSNDKNRKGFQGVDPRDKPRKLDNKEAKVLLKLIQTGNSAILGGVNTYLHSRKLGNATIKQVQESFKITSKFILDVHGRAIATTLSLWKRMKKIKAGQEKKESKTN